MVRDIYYKSNVKESMEVVMNKIIQLSNVRNGSTRRAHL